MSLVREHFHASLILLPPAVHDGLITMEDFATLEVTIQRLQKVMDALGETPDTWGLINACLHETGYIFKGDEARPILFEFCGFGHFLFDISYSLMHLNHDIRLKRRFLESYQSVRELPEDWQGIVEAFWVGGCMKNIAYNTPDPMEREGIVKGTSVFARRECKRVLKGEPFLFETDVKFWKGLA